MLSSMTAGWLTHAVPASGRGVDGQRTFGAGRNFGMQTLKLAQLSAATGIGSFL